MSVDLSLYTDPKSISKVTLGSEIITAGPVKMNVRRITAGGTTVISRGERRITPQTKEDKVAVIMILNSKGDIVRATDRFFLQTIQEQKTEKVQLYETFDENAPSLTFFGKKTLPYSFIGKLMNARNASDSKSDQYEWTASFEAFWDTELRASKLAEKKCIAVLVVDDTLYEGYPISKQVSKNSVDGFTTSFSMSWIIVDHQPTIHREALLKTFFLNSEADIDALVNNINKASVLEGYISILVREIDKIMSQKKSSDVEVEWKNQVFADYKLTDKKAGELVLNPLFPEYYSKLKSNVSKMSTDDKAPSFDFKWCTAGKKLDKTVFTKADGDKLKLFLSLLRDYMQQEINLLNKSI